MHARRGRYRRHVEGYRESMSDERTRGNQATRDAERTEAEQPHDADRPPTAEEEREAEKTQPDPDVSEHEREMTERGARQQGEGRLP